MNPWALDDVGRENLRGTGVSPVSLKMDTVGTPLPQKHASVQMKLNFGRISDTRTTVFATAAAFAAFVSLCVVGSLFVGWFFQEPDLFLEVCMTFTVISVILSFIVLRRSRTSSRVSRRIAVACLSIVIC